MKIISFSRRKKWVRFKRWLSSFDPVDEKLSSEQDKAFRITKKLIVDSKSSLYADLSKERYIIVNDTKFVRITHGKLRIIDGSFKYDIPYDVAKLDLLKRLFARNLEHRHDRIEAEIGSRVEKSLEHILRELEDKQFNTNNNDDNQSGGKPGQEQEKTPHKK
jgi:hypothetical protein